MNPTQDQIKAWWFDRLSDLAATNMALATELAALREQLAKRDEERPAAPPKQNGKGAETGHGASTK
jgi:hypothetical protein